MLESLGLRCYYQFDTAGVNGNENVLSKRFLESRKYALGVSSPAPLALNILEI